MTDKALADAHRRIAAAEHSIERRLLDQADEMPDTEDVRRRARAISENARVHEHAADRIEQRSNVSRPD